MRLSHQWKKAKNVFQAAYLLLEGWVTPINRDYTSISNKTKECINPFKNARVLPVTLRF
jgi:hypothetical protein